MAASDRAGLTTAGGARGSALTVAEGRRFGLTLAAGFAAVGALLWWRGHPRAAAAAWGVGVAAALGGLLLPRRLGPVQRAWMGLGVALSRVTTPVFYSAIYLLVLTPIALVRRTAGRSPLARDTAAPSYWVRRPPTPSAERRQRLERQF